MVKAINPEHSTIPTVQHAGPSWQWLAVVLLGVAGAFGTLVLNNVFSDRDKIVGLQLDVSTIKNDMSYLRKEFDEWKRTR